MCGCWARLAFPRAREKKSISSSNRQNRRGLSIELLPACPRSRTARRPEWIPRRASMVSGGAAPGERALHACDPSEACKREPCPRPLMLPASIAIVCRLIGRALAAAAVRDGHEHGSAVEQGWRARRVSVQCSRNAPYFRDRSQRGLKRLNYELYALGALRRGYPQNSSRPPAAARALPTMKHVALEPSGSRPGCSRNSEGRGAIRAEVGAARPRSLSALWGRIA